MDRISLIHDRLSKSRFRISHDVTLSDGRISQMVASRTSFSWKGFVILSQHLVFLKMENPTVAELSQLSEVSFNLAKQRNWVPLLRGLQFGYMIIPVVIADTITDEVKEYVTSQPPKKWALFEFPVVCDANSEATYYFNGTPLAGCLYFSDLRNIVTKYITEK